MKLKKIAFSLFFLTSFLAQLSMPLYHSLVEELDAEVCSFNDTEHLCNHDAKDSKQLYELKINYNSDYDYELINKTTISSVDALKNNLLKNHLKLSFSLRGPPSFNFI